MKLGQIDLIQKDGTTVEVYDASHSVEFVLNDGRMIRAIHTGDSVRLEMQNRPNVGSFRIVTVGKPGSDDELRERDTG